MDAGLFVVAGLMGERERERAERKRLGITKATEVGDGGGERKNEWLLWR